jgi:hypothetical protein
MRLRSLFEMRRHCLVALLVEKLLQCELRLSRREPRLQGPSRIHQETRLSLRETAALLPDYWS